MNAREFGWSRLVSGLIIGASLLACGTNVVAQHTNNYWGDDACMECHTDKVSYLNHGHPWKLLQTAGTDPTGANNPYPAFWGPINLPPFPTNNGAKPPVNLNGPVSWSDIEYILGDSKNNEAGASYIFKNGYTDSPGRPGDPTPAKSYSCGSCHTTHNWPYTATSTPYNTAGHQLGMPGIAGTWGLDGIQCEMCHGPKTTMTLPTMNMSVYPTSPSTASASDLRACPTCHTGSATDSSLPLVNGVAQRGLAFSATAPYVFTNHHPQGDDFSHSPHYGQTCWICHDPHKSVWHDNADGNGSGVLYSYAEGAGFMCKQCHTQRIFGTMGDPNTPGAPECTDCHMPPAAESGAGAAHIFRIASSKVTGQQLMTASPGTSSNTHTTGSGSSTKTWWNASSTFVTASGKTQTHQAFLTLDLACATACHWHAGASISDLAGAAPYIHRPSGMLDLTINGSDQPQAIPAANPVTVAFSLYAKTKAKNYTGTKVTVYIMCNGPKGTSYWTGSKWVTTKAALYSNYTITKDLLNQVVLNPTKLAAGYMYTYCVTVVPADKSTVAPVAVTAWMY